MAGDTGLSSSPRPPRSRVSRAEDARASVVTGGLVERGPGSPWRPAGASAPSGGTAAASSQPATRRGRGTRTRRRGPPRPPALRAERGRGGGGRRPPRPADDVVSLRRAEIGPVHSAAPAGAGPRPPCACRRPCGWARRITRRAPLPDALTLKYP